MNAILGYAQLLLRDAALAIPQRERVNIILSSGEHLLTLINDVLEMSRIEAGRIVLSPEPFDLRQMLGNVQEMCRGLARAKGLSLAFELGASLPGAVVADPGKIRQVLINLLSNAMKFTAEGGVHVRATALRLPHRGHLVEIVVTDTGVGIDADDVTRIFETFEQTLSGARAGGTGLGLAIGRNLARLMNGDLTVQSIPDVGSAFTFTFEAREASAEAPLEPSRRLVVGLRLAGPPPKILVVDDQPDNLALVGELLHKVGFETQTAQSGEAAIDLHDSWHPDLVLMDLRMPGIGGIEAIRRLRASGSRATLIAFTASGFFELEEEARQAGAVDVLLKPYREAELLERLAKLLGVELVYQGGVSLGQPIRPAPSAVSSLPALLESVPGRLVAELKEALIQARAARIERIAQEIDEHSPDAALLVRALAGDFRYADLASALEAAEGTGAASGPRGGAPGGVS
jgi:CheY-like chemotaxis protein